jgi:hypothetical protein
MPVLILDVFIYGSSAIPTVVNTSDACTHTPLRRPRRRHGEHFCVVAAPSVSRGGFDEESEQEIGRRGWDLVHFVSTLLDDDEWDA